MKYATMTYSGSLAGQPFTLREGLAHKTNCQYLYPVERFHSKTEEVSFMLLQE